MIISHDKDEFGDDLVIGGVVHRIEFSESDVDPNTPVFMYMFGTTNAAFLDQDDIDALAVYFGERRS